MDGALIVELFDVAARQLGPSKWTLFLWENQPWEHAALAAWRRRDAAWIAIGLFAIGFAVMNAIGRAGLGVSWALSSRYVTPASLLLIAAVNLDLRRLALFAVAAAVIVQSLTSIPIGWETRRGRDESGVCLDLLLVNDSPDCLIAIAESDAMLRRGALAVHRVGVRPLVTESDFVTTRVEPSSRGLFVIAGTIQGSRRIIAARVVRGGRPWNLVFPPNLVRQHTAVELWLFVPRDRKLYRLEQRVL